MGKGIGVRQLHAVLCKSPPGGRAVAEWYSIGKRSQANIQ